MGGKVSEDDKQKILDVVEEKLAWLKDSEEASKEEELAAAKKDIEEVAQPIIAALYKENQDGGKAGSSHDDGEL